MNFDYHIHGDFLKWGYQKRMVYSGQSENEMDENWGQPYFKKSLYYDLYCRGSTYGL